MIFSPLYKATTLAAVLLISAAVGAETTDAPRRPAPLPGSTTTSTTQTTSTTVTTQTTAEGRDFSLQLAKAELAKQGIRHPTERQIDAARSSIQLRRSGGEGWGEIAHSQGLNFGKVVSASNHHEPDGQHEEKGERENTRDGFAAASHHSTQGEGGEHAHGAPAGHSAGGGGGSRGGSGHSK